MENEQTGSIASHLTYTSLLKFLHNGKETWPLLYCIELSHWSNLSTGCNSLASHSCHASDDRNNPCCQAKPEDPSFLKEHSP